MASPSTCARAGLRAAAAALAAVAFAPGAPAQDGLARDASKPDGLSAARIAELRELLRRDPDAPWRSVAWRIDLLAAQRDAAAAGKPLFVWAMDGHPLGCT